MKVMVMEAVQDDEEDLLVDGGKNGKKKFVPDVEDGKMVKMKRWRRVRSGRSC